MKPSRVRKMTDEQLVNEIMRLMRLGVKDAIVASKLYVRANGDVQKAVIDEIVKNDEIINYYLFTALVSDSTTRVAARHVARVVEGLFTRLRYPHGTKGFDATHDE